MANSSGLNRPLVAIGVDTGSGVINTNSANFTGMMIQAKDTGRRMQFIGGNYILATRSDLSTAGFVIRSDGSESTRSIYGWNSSTYNYDLGLNSAQFTDGFIQNIKASQVIHLRDAYSTGGWRVETRAQSGKTTITLRGINTNSWNYNLGATGYRINRLFLSNSPDVSSDERLKEDITPNTLGLDFINDLDTNVFRLKQRESDVLQNPLQFGVIAQQLKTTLEQHGIDTTAHSMLSQSEDGFFGVQYEQLIAPTIRAIQELDVKMDDEVNQLKLEIQYLKMKIKHLEENVA
ncbi:tail fiber domain-containing protein [Bacillus sp. JCM 19034]|uniref:tail fiber domain-containing protein n=1 Tax=Bacillus sp. JCM 19034 TaxID=1481928 RepID=UPI00078571D9|nr:tail fiber domain-containing protein [Bacillus sp. JCM 19034]